MIEAASDKAMSKRSAIERIQSQEQDLLILLEREKSKSMLDEVQIGALMEEHARVKGLKEHLENGNPLAVIEIIFQPSSGLYGSVRIDGVDMGKTAIFQTADEVILAASSQWETPFHEVHTWSQDGQIILV